MKLKFYKFFLCFTVIVFYCVCNVFSFSIFGYEPFRNRKNLEDFDVEKKQPSKFFAAKCEICPENILCVPKIQCPAHVSMEFHEKPKTCDLPEGTIGYCCQTGQNHSIYKEDRERSINILELSDRIVEEVREQVDSLMHHSRWPSVQPGHPDFLHNIVFHSNLQDDIESQQQSIYAMEEIIASQIFRQREQTQLENFETNKIDVDFEASLGHHCSPPPVCPFVDGRYRTIDGTCNNPQPQRSMWGAAGQPMERLLPPAYEDGIWLPRAHGVDGVPLTSAREISRILLDDIDRPHPRYNLLLMQFGQFLAHDITQSSSIRLENGDAIECCTPDGSSILPPSQRHFACMPVTIAPNDEFYSNFHQGCINFVRLSLSPSSNCRMSYGKQRNLVTHFIDASQVYGSNLQVSKKLRSFRGGKLRMFDESGRDLLPLTRDREVCGSNEQDNVCFESGDGRTNQIISLLAFHIFFAREHNRIADALQKINRHWNDELLYQEARRIVIAEIQHIVYNEYLPIVIGSERMNQFGLFQDQYGYDANVKPALTNEFSGAAFRFGHSTVAGHFYLQSGNGSFEAIEIPDVMFNPGRFRERSFLDEIVNTMMEQPLQDVQGSMSYGLSRYLFRGGNPFGLDLAALNIQRGRDHALRNYNSYLEVKGLRRIQSFNELPKDVARKLSLVYRHPEDIDLWVGGLLEQHSDKFLVGSTFGEIIADQFSRLKRGDRYFYEYDSNVNPGAFTPMQLRQIKKATIARIICDNTDHIGVFEVPRQAFVRPNIHGNQKVSCNEIPHVNLQAWKV